MEFTCYGCRGSYPITREDSMKYGGNTTCYFIEEDDTKLIIDGGTGITTLGRYLYGLYYPDPLKLNIFLSHGHWDHIMGLPLFHPFYFENNTFTIYAPGSKESDVSRMITKLHHLSNSSIPFEKLKAEIKFKNLKSNNKLDLGNIIIETYQINHPSMDFGYRITSKVTERTITILTDIAPIEGNYLPWGWKEVAKGRELEFEKEYYDNLIKFSYKSDVLIFDTQFTEKDIKGKRHWGHSTPEMALKLAEESKSESVMLTHHNPDYNDEKVDKIFKSACRKGKNLNLNVLIAKERGKFTL
jgi:ribonuclease BN (tRNA processing enzyme)